MRPEAGLVLFFNLFSGIFPQRLKGEAQHFEKDFAGSKKIYSNDFFNHNKNEADSFCIL